MKTTALTMTSVRFRQTVTSERQRKRSLSLIKITRTKFILFKRRPRVMEHLLGKLSLPKALRTRMLIFLISKMKRTMRLRSL